jgi:hypothetical protein
MLKNVEGGMGLARPITGFLNGTQITVWTRSNRPSNKFENNNACPEGAGIGGWEG